MTLDEVLSRIDGIMGLTPHGIAKTTSYYELARQAPEGPVLELGCYRGIGTLAFLAGAKGLVYALDLYEPTVGWIGEPYGPEDEAKLRENLADLGGWEVVKSDCRLASVWWDTPLALILWDVSQRNRMADDFWAWERHLMPGGIFALRDLDHQELGSDKVTAQALATGRYHEPTFWPGYIWSVRKHD
jgi:hypothetical protein